MHEPRILHSLHSGLIHPAHVFFRQRSPFLVEPRHDLFAAIPGRSRIGVDFPQRGGGDDARGVVDDFDPDSVVVRAVFVLQEGDELGQFLVVVGFSDAHEAFADFEGEAFVHEAG